MNFETEYALKEFRKAQSDLFDENGKRWLGTGLSNREAEQMLNLINLLEKEVLSAPQREDGFLKALDEMLQTHRVKLVKAQTMTEANNEGEYVMALEKVRDLYLSTLTKK